MKNKVVAYLDKASYEFAIQYTNEFIHGKSKKLFEAIMKDGGYGYLGKDGMFHREPIEVLSWAKRPKKFIGEQKFVVRSDHSDYADGGYEERMYGDNEELFSVVVACNGEVLESTYELDDHSDLVFWDDGHEMYVDTIDSAYGFPKFDEGGEDADTAYKKIEEEYRLPSMPYIAPPEPEDLGCVEIGNSVCSFSDGKVLENTGVPSTTKDRKKMISVGGKITFWTTTSGYGGTFLELPDVLPYKQHLDAVKKLCDEGFPKEHVVVNVEPVIPTKKGIELAKNVVRYAWKLGFRNFRYVWLANVSDYWWEGDLKAVPPTIKEADHDIIDGFIDFCAKAEKYGCMFNSMRF